MNQRAVDLPIVSFRNPLQPFMCEKHPLSNICTPQDEWTITIDKYSIFRSQEKTKLEAEEDCKNLGPGWNLAFLKSKEWVHFEIRLP